MRGPFVTAKQGIEIRLGWPATAVIRNLPANRRAPLSYVIQTTPASDLGAHSFDTPKKYRESGNLACRMLFIDKHNGRYK